MLHERYNRQIILPQIQMEGQQKLQVAKVLVVGAGGLGCPVLQYLSAAGVGTLSIADGDTVIAMNLNRQVLYYESDIGKDKTSVCKEKLFEQNSALAIHTYPAITRDNALQIIEQNDVVVDCTDNFSARYLLNDACVICNKPLVHASVYRFDGSLSVFNYTNKYGEKGATYRCLFPSPPEHGEIENCSESGVLGSLTGIIGCMQANEVLKIVAKFGEVLSGKLLVFDGLTGQSHLLKVKLKEENLSITALAENYDFSCGINIKEISVIKLIQKMNDGEDIQLVDVRTAEEYAAFHLKSSFIPVTTLEENIQLIDRDKPVILYCEQGTRSAAAIKLLQEQYHFDNLYNLQGGLHAWKVQNAQDNLT
ncbi:MAG: HesA/MoeB/ThiF family protein [Bacteroidota bacterium]|nr:HesA/MoeB/ThiF family protein [Bacteroidota bacterium]